MNTAGWLFPSVGTMVASLLPKPRGLDERLKCPALVLLQTHFSFPGCCSSILETRSANSQSYTAIIERSWLDLAGKRAGFLPAAPISAHVAGRSCSSSKLEMPCVVLSSTLSLLSLPPQSHNGLVCWFPGQGSAHCDFATTALGDNI